MEEFKAYFADKKKLFNVVTLLVIALAIPIGINLLKNSQFFFSQARGIPIEVTDGECVKLLGSEKVLTCTTVPLKIISPIGPPSPAVSASISPSPTSSSTTSPSPTATSPSSTKTTQVLSNKIIQWTYSYPTSDKITRVVMPATTGVSFEINGQSANSGQALDANLGAGTSTIVFKVTADTACSPYTISINLTHENGTIEPSFIGAGSATAYGNFCQTSPTPTAVPDGSSGTDELGINLTAVASCVSGNPLITFSNGGRSDTNNFHMYKNGIQLHWFAGLFSRPPTQQMVDSNPGLGVQNTYYIQAVDGPLAGKKSNSYTITAPTSCSSAKLNNQLPKISLGSILADIKKTSAKAINKLIPTAYAQCQPASAPSNLSPTGTIPPGLTTFTWTGSPGAQYDFRLNDGTASWQAVCNGQVQSNRSLCTDNLQTNSVQVNLQPGVLQGWWVHAHNACSYTPAVGAQITVSAAQSPSPTPSSSPTASPTSSPTVSPSSSPTSSPSPTPSPTATTQSAFYLYPPTTQTVATTTCATADLRQTTIPWDSVTDSGGNHNYTKTFSKSQLDSTYPQWVIGAGLNGNKDQPATVTIAGQTYTISASNWSSHDDTYLEFYYTGAFRKIHGVTADNFTVAGTGTIAVPASIVVSGSSLSSYSGGAVPPNTGVDIKYCGAAQPNPQCSDTTDNDGDSKIDIADPGCHSDGNPNNPDSYVPSDDDETDEAQTECSDNADNDDDSLIDEDDPGCHDDGNAGNPSSYNPDDDDETNEIPSFTVEYRIAETEAGLNDVEFEDYDEEPIFTNFELSDPTPGDKFIWVEFKASDGRTEIRHIRIRLVGDPPEIKGVVCNLDIARENVKITVEGKNLGTDQGKVTADGKDTEILEWTNDLVTALMNKPNISNDQTNRFKIAISGSDGTLIKEVPCEIDTALIYLGARLFCREPGKFDVEGVKVRILDSIKTSVEETVSIDKEGVVKGLQTRLQAGSRYALSIKAPYSLRRNTYFTASAGTTVVESDTGGDFILPVGDIAPKVRVDGFINSLDRSELSTQWRVLGTQTTVRTGDFNRDTKVNSVDWACMRFDFNQSDADLPTEVPAEDNPEATPAPTSAPTPTVTPTSTASSTAPPSTLPADEDEDTPPPASPTPTASTSPTP